MSMHPQPSTTSKDPLFHTKTLDTPDNLKLRKEGEPGTSPGFLLARALAWDAHTKYGPKSSGMIIYEL